MGVADGEVMIRMSHPEALVMVDWIHRNEHVELKRGSSPPE